MKTMIEEIEVYSPVLKKIIEECDKYQDVETGGRLIGKYYFNDNAFKITLIDIIGAGPRAERNFSSFFPDTDYLLKAFRYFESQDNEIHHIGSWHSHYCNGLEDLSSGDIKNYVNVIQNPNYCANFFIAILVIPGSTQKYDLKFYISSKQNPRPRNITGSSIVTINTESSSQLKPFNLYKIYWYEKQQGRDFIIREYSKIKSSGIIIKPIKKSKFLCWKSHLIDKDNNYHSILFKYSADFLKTRKFIVEAFDGEFIINAEDILQAIYKMFQLTNYYFPYQQFRLM